MNSIKSIESIESYDASKPVRIWLGNLAKYNEGSLVGAWLSLPMEESDLNEAVSTILGTDEEYQLNDWETDFPLPINQWSSIKELNTQAAALEALDSIEQAQISFLVENHGMTFEDALESYQDVIVYEGDLSDVAAQMLDEGCFGEVPESLQNYIDLEAIGRDLDIDGYTYDSSQNLTFHYCG